MIKRWETGVDILLVFMLISALSPFSPSCQLPDPVYLQVWKQVVIHSYVLRSFAEIDNWSGVPRRFCVFVHNLLIKVVIIN